MEVHVPSIAEVGRRLDGHTQRLNDHGQRLGAIEREQVRQGTELHEARSDTAKLEAELRSFKRWFIGISLPGIGLGLTILGLLLDK